MKDVLDYLKKYLRNPIEQIKAVPNWDWLTIIIVQVALSAACGFVAGIFAKSFLAVLGQTFLFPVATLLSSFVGTAFFYYALIFLLKQQVSFQKLYIVISLAYLPYVILKIFGFLGPLIALIGFALVCLLITVGLIENFQLEKKRIVQLMLALCGLFVIIWIVLVITRSKDEIHVESVSTPESLKIIQEEFSQ